MDKMSKKPVLKFTILALFLLVNIFVGLFVYQLLNHKAEKFDPSKLHGTYIPPGRALPSFVLKDTNGHDFKPSDLIGHWTLLFFGYTQCHSICPAAMAELHKMNTILHQSYQINPFPQVYMISLDPARDTVTSLGQYVHGFDKDFHGALGAEKMINTLSQQLGVVYDAQPKADGQIDHSGSVTVINPQGEVAAFFTPPLNAQLMAQDLEILSHQSDIR
jgi:protein SCO1/2